MEERESVLKEDRGAGRVRAGEMAWTGGHGRNEQRESGVDRTIIMCVRKRGGSEGEQNAKSWEGGQELREQGAEGGRAGGGTKERKRKRELHNSEAVQL